MSSIALQEISKHIAHIQEKNRYENQEEYKKSVAVFAALAICLTLSVTAIAAPGVVKGFFQDIVNRRGAIVGTSYEQATDEITMNVTAIGDRLTVLAAFTDPQAAPYAHTEKLGISEYRIVDENDRIVKEGSVEAADIINGHAAVSILLDDIDNGNYKLVVHAFVVEKKADQPLNIRGSWECVFTK